MIRHNQKSNWLNDLSSLSLQVQRTIRYPRRGIILFFPQPQGDFNEFGYRLIRELSCWGSPLYSCARWIHINEKLLFPIRVGGFVGSTKLGFVLNFEGPELACPGLHVLQPAQPRVKERVQEDAGVIALFP